jgi:hypothetical protein
VGRKSHPFSAALVDLLNRSGSTSLASDCFPDPEYNLDASTAEFYSRPLDNGFVGRNGSIRKLLDYQYHNNYTNERQEFQDALIERNVMTGGGSSSDKPWYVLSSGPMASQIYVVILLDQIDSTDVMHSIGCR